MQMARSGNRHLRTCFAALVNGQQVQLIVSASLTVIQARRGCPRVWYVRGLAATLPKEERRCNDQTRSQFPSRQMSVSGAGDMPPLISRVRQSAAEHPAEYPGSVAPLEVAPDAERQHSAIKRRFTSHG